MPRKKDRSAIWQRKSYKNDFRNSRILEKKFDQLFPLNNKAINGFFYFLWQTYTAGRTHVKNLVYGALVTV